MAGEKEKFLIVVKSGAIKPQQRTIALEGQPWDLEWSTSSDVPMSIDFFNLTVGKYLRAAGEQQGQNKKIEECWRVTGIPGHARKIRYGSNMPDATSTQAKPLEDGIYVVKITGMATITEGLHAESGIGMAAVRLSPDTPASQGTPASSISNTRKSTAENGQPVIITNDLLASLLDQTEEDPPTA